VVKLGKTFSIFLVFTLLILLAPAVVLTGGSVAQGNGEAVTEEITATFTFSEEIPGGQWWPFSAGSAVPAQTPGPLLEQYTRNRVIGPNGAGIAVPGCAFRNYTATASPGVVTSTVGDLNGTMTLGWITVAFPGAYPGDPKYTTGTNFGWVMGRGNYADEGDPASNFSFGFVIDWDGTSEMANAAGKGFMVSANETGRFGEMLDPQELRHKIIGDFDVTKTGAAYTWNFHLRNYPPNEIYNNGILLVEGGVLQELTDTIHTGLDLMNFLADGPHPTFTDHSTDFEEVAFGRDPAKTITAGYLGVNASMDVSRNTILCLEVNAGADYVRIQGTTTNHIYINDTYAVTGDDGTMYGEQNELLFLYIHDQKLNITEFFYQYGYTFTPFGLNAPCTDWYTGKETFADAGIAIEASVGEALQDSTDIIYSLYPHPKVASVVPDAGLPNTTMDVTITGKYFLRADDNIAPNSGSVDFGAGITVNSYAIGNSSPIDNSIVANITIAGGAAPGARVVNVTSCFNYTDGNGTAPYKSGLGAFTVVTGDAILNGTADLLRKEAAPDPTWETPLVVEGYLVNTSTEIWERNAVTDDTGDFVVTGLTPGPCDICVKNWTTLSKKVSGVVLISGVPVDVDFGSLSEGDVNDDDKCNILDLSALGGSFGKSLGDPGYNEHADFNRDDKVNILDLSTLGGNFGSSGDCL
jgi:hypothetical protein